MAKKSSTLAGIFDDKPEEPALAPAPTPEEAPEPQLAVMPRRSRRSRRSADTPLPATSARRSSRPSKKPMLIHIPEDIHRALRQLSVEEGEEPLTVVTEHMLRQYLVKRGHTRFAP